jgi:hypothetical protein
MHPKVDRETWNTATMFFMAGVTRADVSSAKTSSETDYVFLDPVGNSSFKGWVHPDAYVVLRWFVSSASPINPEELSLARW